MKIDRITLFCSLILTLAAAKSLCSACGPNGKCLCDNYELMDCSRTKISIREICDFINKSVTIENSVSTLHVEWNDYKSIEEFDLGGCYNLSRLYFEGNEISSIEKGSFTNLFRLELLDICKNRLDFYNETVQHNFTFPLTLHTLMLNGNMKANTSDSESYPTLSYLTNLSVLYMDGLQGKIFPDVYRTSEKLTTLILSGRNGNCNISQVTNSTFRNLLYLRTLNISSCNIENIHAGAFQSLANLEVLDLSENLGIGFRMLRNVSYGLQFTNIKSLNYSKVYNTFGMGTQLRKRDVCYLWNTTLNELVLNKNRVQLFETNTGLLMPDTLKIVRIEDNIFTFGPYLLQLGCIANLTEIYASYQNTAHRPRLFEEEPVENQQNENIVASSDCPFMQDEFLHNISKMKMEKNIICHFFESDKINISENLPTFPVNLTRVEFSQCDMEYNLTEFRVFPIAHHIEYLDFSGNMLYSWIGPIGPFPSLKHLKLSQNYCSHIGLKFFDSMTSVEYLQLQENFLGLVLSNERYGPFIFDSLVNVKVLNLSSNIISYLPSSGFSKMSKLQILDLSVNNIDTWTINARPFSSLLHLNLKLNFFHRLPAELTNKLVSNAHKEDIPFTIDLRNNTFTTNCDEKEFLKWMVKYKSNMVSFDQYILHNKTGAYISPQRFVTVVNGLDMACRSYTLLIVLTSVGMAVFLAVLVGGLIYKNRWQLRYLMRTSKIRYFGYQKLTDNPMETMNFTHDAFISYANENIRFILDKIIPNLESQGMKLCVHDRDFLPGNNIADNILDAIQNSKKTVVILSKDFLKSKWCVYEFNMARMESIYCRDGENCLLVVMFEDVPTRNMSTEMLEWIRSNTYIEYTAEAQGEELFWQNLKDALSS